VVSDCYAAQLKIPAKHHQICGVHLLRELKNFIECHRTWVSDKTLVNIANALKIETFQLLLPLEKTFHKPITCDEAVKKLVKIKRSYDDSFNEIVNLIKNTEVSGKKAI
jgi:hypothetical protein